MNYNTTDIETEFIEKGMILNSDAYYLDENNEKKLLIKGGQKFTQEIIDFLKSKNIKKIFYYTEDKNDKKGNEVEKKLLISREIAEAALKLSKDIELSILTNRLLPQKEIALLVDNLIRQVQLIDSNTIVNLIEMKNYDDYLYSHSINVAILSLLLAKAMDGLEESKYSPLGIAAILHDIGKLNIPKEILNKKTPLTEEDWILIKKHPYYSYNIIKNSSSFSDEIKEIVLNHHEAYDGSGYPRGLKGEQISLLSEIINISHSFNAMISDRPYRKKKTLRNAIIEVALNSGKKFSPLTTKKFIHVIIDKILFKDFIPNNSFLRLNTNEIAIINKNNEFNYLKPLINIFLSSEKKILNKPIIVDLEKDFSREIIEIITEEEDEYNNINFLYSKYVNNL